jgi:hypothetical protein
MIRRNKFIFLAAIAITLVLIVSQAHTIYSNRTSLSTHAFAPQPSSIIYPNPISPNVTVGGIMTSTTIAPTCSLASPPCAFSDSPLYFLVVNGWYYRLIFPNSTRPPVNHSHIIVTGVFVTPSTYQENLWTPTMNFAGDIYVMTYSYYSPYY